MIVRLLQKLGASQPGGALVFFLEHSPARLLIRLCGKVFSEEEKRSDRIVSVLVFLDVLSWLGICRAAYLLVTGASLAA